MGHNEVYVDEKICLAELRNFFDESSGETLEAAEPTGGFTPFGLTHLNVTSNKEIRSHRRWIGKIIVLLKRTIRKILQFYIQPIVEEQNEVNREIGRAVNYLNTYIDCQSKGNANKESFLNSEKEEFEALKDTVKVQQLAIEELQRQLSKYNRQKIKKEGNNHGKQFV